MEELLEKLKALSETNIWAEDGYFQDDDHELVPQIESLCNDYLIGPNGGCCWDNIDILKENGYHVYAGEKDSFGWLTGVIEFKDGRKIVYG